MPTSARALVIGLRRSLCALGLCELGALCCGRCPAERRQMMWTRLSIDRRRARPSFLDLSASLYGSERTERPARLGLGSVAMLWIPVNPIAFSRRYGSGGRLNHRICLRYASQCHRDRR